ncbi:EbsA family protein, partial [Salmonella enterica subsp. enterica serovar Istanbul]|nr:EbsA family protein [Salmonella enterica subsp. enterica serovar Istanbul]
MKKNIRWQPELAHTIIYWSLTLIILFFSLILSLENTGPYWKSNIVLGVFLVFLFLGWRRSFILKSNSVIIRYAA